VFAGMSGKSRISKTARLNFMIAEFSAVLLFQCSILEIASDASAAVGLAGVASIIVYPSVLSSRCYYYYRSSASFNVVRTSLSSRQSPVDCPVVNMIPACTSPYQRRRLHRTRYRVAHFLLTLYRCDFHLDLLFSFSFRISL